MDEWIDRQPASQPASISNLDVSSVSVLGNVDMSSAEGKRVINARVDVRLCFRF